MHPVEIYTKHYCGWCRRAKSLLEELEIDFREIPVDDDPERRREMIVRAGRSTVPQIFIRGRHVGGYDELKALESGGRLDELLRGDA